MGLLAKLVPKLGGLAQKFGGFIPGVGPVVSKVGGLLAKLPGKKIAAVVGAGAGFELGGRAVRGGPSGVLGGMARGGFMHPHKGYSVAGREHWHGGRKKRAGLTANDIRGAQKVARIVTMFGFKPKLKKRKRGR
jgi:hypothetical protein